MFILLCCIILQTPFGFHLYISSPKGFSGQIHLLTASVCKWVPVCNIQHKGLKLYTHKMHQTKSYHIVQWRKSFHFACLQLLIQWFHEMSCVNLNVLHFLFQQPQHGCTKSSPPKCAWWAFRQQLQWLDYKTVLINVYNVLCNEIKNICIINDFFIECQIITLFRTFRTGSFGPEKEKKEVH